MTQPCSGRLFGILVSLTLGALLITGVIALATAKEECGTRNGRKCVANNHYCSGNHKCFCPGSIWEPESGSCNTKHLTWSTKERIALGILLCFFLLFSLASILACISRCYHTEKLRSAPKTIVVAPEPYPLRREP
eukprot:g1735.t1